MHGVVVLPPAFDDNLGLLERVEDLLVERFVLMLRLGAFAVAVFPWLAGMILAVLAPTNMAQRLLPRRNPIIVNCRAKVCGFCVLTG